MTQGYPAKIILAWAEAVGGNRELRDWLMQNGYMELALFVFAAHLKKDARTWLMKEGFPHLMATLSCAEGDEKACLWLSNHDYEVLAMVGKAADNDEYAMRWLIDTKKPEFARLAVRLRTLKNEIQSRHDDMHFISPE